MGLKYHFSVDGSCPAALPTFRMAGFQRNLRRLSTTITVVHPPLTQRSPEL